MMLEFVLEDNGANVRVGDHTWRYGNAYDAQNAFNMLKLIKEGFCTSGWLDYRHHIAVAENSSIILSAVIDGWCVMVKPYDVSIADKRKEERCSSTYRLKDEMVFKINKTIRSLGGNSDDTSKFLAQIDEDWRYCLKRGDKEFTAQFRVNNSQVAFDMTENDFEKDNEK